MYGKSIYFIPEHANEACKEFTSKVKKWVTGYHQLNQIIKTFDAVVEKSEK